MAKFHTRKCPACNGELVKSKFHKSGHTTYFWAKPWAKIFGATSKVYPWACMNCGRVLFYFEEKEFESIKHEYEYQKMR